MLQVGVQTEGMLLISRMICFGILMGLTMNDMRYQKIPTSILVISSFLATVSCLCLAKNGIISNLIGLAIGLFFVFLSKITKEGLGYGDSWLLCILGAYLGAWLLLEVLFVVWVAVGVVAMIAVVSKRWSRKTAIPLVPVITIGYLVMWGSELIEGAMV